MPQAHPTDEKHDQTSSDYDRVRKAIAFISQEWRRQPNLDEIAEAVGISASHLHAVFRRWSGLSPKAFLQAVTLDHARRLLKDDASRSDASSFKSLRA